MPAIAALVFALTGLGSLGYGAYEKLRKKPTTRADARQGMPPELLKAYQTLLTTGKDPNAMDQMASTLEGYGYTASASELRARAAELRKAKAQGLPPPPPPTPITSPAPAERTVILAMVNTASDPLIMRSSPSTSGGMVTTMPKGAMVQILNPAAAPGWAQVAYNGKTGYASTQYLKMPSAALPPSLSLPAPSPTLAAVLTATLTGTGVNMRNAPSTSGGIVAQLSRPEIVTVLDWNAGTSGGYQWAQVRKMNGIAGYVAKNYLALNAPAPAAVSGEDMTFIGADDRSSPRPARCASPGGCRLRVSPRPDSPFRALVANSERVTVLKQVPGQKAERNSPSPGGWSLVRAGRNVGWLPSEWLLLS